MAIEKPELKLYVEDDTPESREAAKLLEKAGLDFSISELKGKITVELLVGDDEWITGLPAIKAWLKDRKGQR